MIYELWNSKTRNLVASFASEDDALAFVRSALRDHGVDYVTRLVLARENRQGRSETVSIGQDLIDRARDEGRSVGKKPLAVVRPA